MGNRSLDDTNLNSTHIIGVDACVLEGTRPREIGCNSRLGVHGSTNRDTIVRIHTDTGITGWGWAKWRWSPARYRATAREIIGKTVADAYGIDKGTADEYLDFDTPLWDLAGRLLNKPVYQLLREYGTSEVPVYDGSIYMEDVDWRTGDDLGLEPVLNAIRDGLETGYRAFKLKLGRGYRWMEARAGFKRDIEVVHAARELIGPDCALLIDGNNGFTVDQAKTLLSETRNCSLYWFEEPFPETKEHCGRLKSFIQKNGIDVVQFDLRSCTITPWKSYMNVIREKDVLAAPHNWGSYLLNYYVPQFGAGCGNFAMAETDRSSVHEIDNSAYVLENGMLLLPQLPGFGLELDPRGFTLAQKARGGFSEGIT